MWSQGDNTATTSWASLLIVSIFSNDMIFILSTSRCKYFFSFFGVSFLFNVEITGSHTFILPEAYTFWIVLLQTPNDAFVFLILPLCTEPLMLLAKINWASFFMEYQRVLMTYNRCADVCCFPFFSFFVALDVLRSFMSWWSIYCVLKIERKWILNLNLSVTLNFVNFNEYLIG